MIVSTVNQLAAELKRTQVNYAKLDEWNSVLLEVRHAAEELLADASRKDARKLIAAIERERLFVFGKWKEGVTRGSTD